MPGPMSESYQGPDAHLLETDRSADHPLTKELREIVRKNALSCGIILTMDGERVGINSSGATDKMGAIMERLGNEVLAAFQRGDFDHVLQDS